MIMADSFTIDEVRVIVAEFNKKHGFNLIETETPSRVKTLYSIPTAQIIIHSLTMSGSYGVNIYWSSVYFNKQFRFSGRGKRSHKRKIGLQHELDVYRKDILNKINDIIDLYLAA